jgi:hypothetical protein
MEWLNGVPRAVGREWAHKLRNKKRGGVASSVIYAVHIWLQCPIQLKFNFCNLFLMIKP